MPFQVLGGRILMVVGPDLFQEVQGVLVGMREGQIQGVLVLLLGVLIQGGLAEEVQILGGLALLVAQILVAEVLIQLVDLLPYLKKT